MHLYEVIRWGNDSDDVVDGGPNGSDTCFLVRADSAEEAGEMADAVLRRITKTGFTTYSTAIHLLGTDGGKDKTALILRGPYYQNAYRHGWRLWERDSEDGPWYEN